MLPWAVIDQALTPDGTTLVLASRGDEWVVSAGGHTLMSSRMHGSEEALAHFAFARAPRAHSVLLGGLGLGYSLRAVLDRLPASGLVTVAELAPAVVEWNRTHVASLARRPLDDGRVRVHVGDVLRAIRQAAAEWDLILLDVDNKRERSSGGDVGGAGEGYMRGGNSASKSRSVRLRQLAQPLPSGASPPSGR